MVAHPPWSISFIDLANLLAFCTVLNKTLPAWERVLQRGVKLDALTYQYTHPLLAIINDPDTLLSRILMKGLPRSTTEDNAIRIERILREEFALFLQQTDSPTQERFRILTQLAAPVDVIQRIHELCFFPGVIFPWCMAVMQLTEHMRTCNHALRKQLDALDHHLRVVSSFFTSQHAWPLSVDMACMRQVLQEVDARCDTIDDWKRKCLGIDKTVTRDTRAIVDDVRLPFPYTPISIDPQKQVIWSHIFFELVNLLHPYCSGPKRHSWAKRPSRRPLIPDQTFQHASRLMHLAYPALWPNDDYTLVKARYHSFT